MVEFITVCDELKKDILADLEQVHKLPREAIEWINEVGAFLVDFSVGLTRLDD